MKATHILFLIVLLFLIISCKSSINTDMDLKNKAIETNDATLCAKIENEMILNTCLERLILKGGDISICDYLERPGSKNGCIFSYADVNKDVTACDKMVNAETALISRDNCYMHFISMRFAPEERDYSVCEKVEDPGYVNTCYYSQALNQKNPEICEKIVPIDEEDDRKEKCIEMLTN